MVMTSHPSHDQGEQLVKARILADTVCQPHGDVSAGEVVTVSVNEFFKLKHANKAEIATEQVEAEPRKEGDDSKLVSIDELRVELGKMSKAELVAGAKENYGIDLSENSKKEELIAAILAVAVQEQEEK